MSEALERPSGRPTNAPLPTGTLTFLFTDIAGSTERWERHRGEMQAAVRRHDAVLTAAIESHGGHIFKTVGDAFCAVFERPEAAAPAALAVQRAISSEDFSAVDGLEVRTALHTGTSDERGGDYYGPAVNRVARLLGIAHGGQILVSGVTADLVLGQLPQQATLRDLGSHRLKDLAHPEQVYQLLAPDIRADFPPLRSLESLPNNLPLQLTSFVGRDAEVAEITKLLSEHRLVTLAGSGGVGKTRTSLQVGANLLDASGDGVWFVELAPLNEASLLPAAIATAMRLDLPTQGDPLDSLVNLLKQRRLLLILDNCEHLVEPAAAVVSAILRGCPSVSILASSRQGLGIAGEETFRMPSLSVPSDAETADLSAAKAAEFGAIALFVERAVSADKRFALSDENAPVIAEIVKRLDGIPLAIELAAPRIKILSPAQLRQRLDERFRILTGGSRDALPRQQTLRALIDWSYDLLDERERALFRRAGIFVDGFTFEAAVGVCTDATLDEIDIFDVLASIVDKSLIVAEFAQESTRYRLLESTRAYALDKLATTAELDVMAARHLEYFCATASRAAEVRETTGSDALYGPLNADLDNLRAALGWSLGHSQPVQAATLSGALIPLWDERGLYNEGVQRLESCLAILPVNEHRLAARLLSGIAILAGNSLRFSQAFDAAERALVEARISNDPETLFRCLRSFSVQARRANHMEASTAADEEMDRIENFAPTPIQRASILQNRALLATLRGDAENGRRFGFEARAQYRALGNVSGEANSTINLAETEHQFGATDRAIELVRETLTRTSALARGVRANLEVNLAGYLVSQGDVAGARAAAASTFSAMRDSNSGLVTIALEHTALGHALSGDPRRAARLEGYCAASFAAMGYAREPTEQATFDKLTGLLASAYSEEQLRNLYAEGAALDERQAIAEALHESEPGPNDTAGRRPRGGAPAVTNR